MIRAIAVVLLVLAAVACTETDESSPANIGANATVVALDGEHIYFGDENRRSVDVPVTFPEPGPLYDSIRLQFALRCPNDRCDWWDRVGWLTLVQNPGSDDEQEIEISRFVTPYRVGAAWQVEVGDLSPVLRGDVVLRIFIDTWVGPGHTNGDGWLVDASFVFRGGVPTAEPFRVIPLWSPTGVVYGDPLKATARTTTVDIPSDTRAARTRTLVTGHGQGSLDNCAEFCPRTHWLDVNGSRHDTDLWRDDCETTAAPNQQGTWKYARAGWCPGAKVHAWFAVVSDDVEPSTSATITYDVEPWINTCRPDSPECAGCVAGSCDYDGGAHTEPRYYLSSVLVLYR